MWVKGVGEQLSKYLKKKKIEKIKDIILNLPYSETDRSKLFKLNELEVGKIQSINPHRRIAWTCSPLWALLKLSSSGHLIKRKNVLVLTVGFFYETSLHEGSAFYPTKTLLRFLE